MSKLFCNKCGCAYMSGAIALSWGVVAGREPGSVCRDRSGGINTTAHPCDGRLTLTEYTDYVRALQRWSNEPRRYPHPGPPPG